MKNCDSFSLWWKAFFVIPLALCVNIWYNKKKNATISASSMQYSRSPTGKAKNSEGNEKK
jgi:hypothetical protein